ncbi:relaxase/mobilization nuclease RlxS [Sphingobium lignivorans]|uniref:Type IV secretory pathway VirD2 relaxase n=1 Tax=Sphingobium lignivorans TaxID=2735886 RepID=A0ABR6NGX5_9SPHN|nr:relaxase/mobilization nuclease RlxS [Sphingobium lignivorans]MBB5986535.1 type IV secretory pathway VirD2 relaxase [Sphingobium lignivorans]
MDFASAHGRLFAGRITLSMSTEDEFEPRLGRIRSGSKSRSPRKFLHRVIAAANLARGGAPGLSRKPGFTGSRIGRGAGVGRVLASRDRFAAFRQRRVIVKIRPVTLGGKGFAVAKAHLRYVERDGTTRDGDRGQLYGAETDKVDRNAWLDQARDDRHQFRIIVSPEDGADYEDLKPLTRRLMTRMEEDLGTKLDWVAVDHYNTGHPHTHIIVRGIDERGRDLVIARDYISHGLRERACELVDLDLGPRTDDAIELRLRAEVGQERLTSIDRALIREADANILVSSDARGAFDQAIRMGRLKKLERLGLATQFGAAHWRLAPDLAGTLRRMGERGDIIRTMQRAYAARGQALAIADQAIYDPTAPGARPLVGRIAERGLSDEHADRHYLIVEAADGRSHYVAIGKGENVEAHETGAIVRITPVETRIRAADRTVAEVAAANGGRYTVDAHLRHDPSATEAFAESHVRRLEAMRRLTKAVEREPDGAWIIAPDHLDRAAAYEAARARDRPIAVETLSHLPLEKLVDADAATWLDRELVAPTPEPLRDAAFGQDAVQAQARRRQWLMAQGLAEEMDGQWTPRPDMLTALQRRELLRVAGQLSDELGLPFAEAGQHERIEGRFARTVELVSGRHALIERSRDFTLVPWRPVLGPHVGKSVSGIMRDGGISWSLGRQRSGPSIS